MAPGLPNYQCAAYRNQLSAWRLVDDVCSASWLRRDDTGRIPITEKAKTYLPREAAEDDQDYSTRLQRSPFDDRFARSLRQFVNLLLANGITLETIPPVIEDQLPNIDLHGSTLRRMTQEIALAVLRRGHTFVLVDFPAGGQPMNEAQYAASGRRPYWVHLPATQVIDWIHDGQNLLQLTLMETATIRDGEFSEKQETFYKVFKPGRFDSFTVVKNDRGEEIAIHHPDRSGVMGWVLPSGLVEPFPFIPIVCIYGGTKIDVFQSRPPLKALADLNLTHYQVRSDHLRKLHLCCMPVPELRDSMRPDGEPLKLGPTSFVHIRDPQGSFNWKEPLATSIEQSRREVLDLEATMDLLGASYLLSPSDRQAAATTMAQVVELESDLQGFADTVSEGITECLALHGRYYRLHFGGSATLSGNVIKDQGKDANLLIAYSNLGERGQIDAASLLSLLKDQQFLPEDFDIARATLLNRDPRMLQRLFELVQGDAITKREFLTLIKQFGYLPAEFDIDASISATGETIRIAAVGTLRAQPTPDDRFLPPPGTSLNGG
ncbi:MAG: DUF4055 domain-containing protein [Scytolyngbya sp. HA4215-MV1]|jgi:hypothetical protein|nr:DUF4055 domain-containing protein [Scytolyngbya sp. HA4215-MV1]